MKLSELDIRTIRIMKLYGFSVREIARKFDITENYAYSLQNKKKKTKTTYRRAA